MPGDVLGGLRDEVLAESMRAATLVGLASIPAGFCWIYVFGARSAVVVVFAGVVVGAIYSGRPTPVHRAAARVGIFAPLPTLVVQSYANVTDVVTQSWSPIVTAAFVGLLLLMVLAAWVVFVFLLVVLPALVTAAIVQAAKPYVPGSVSSVSDQSNRRR